MAKIDRYNGNIEAFAADALSTERTIFGDTAQSDTLDANITANFLRGWGIVGVNENPTKQDFNGLAFTLGQLISYLHQRGIAEWNTAQEYFDGSVVTTDVGIYRLKSAGVGSSDPDTDGGVNWERVGISDPDTGDEIDWDLIPTQAEVDAKADKATTYTETEVDGLLDAKADQATTYTETEVDGLLDAKADKATTYTETEVDGLLDGLLDGLVNDGPTLQDANITVTVGTGGDYPTINAALEYLSKLQPVYDSAGITATINLLPGFVMAEQVLVRGLDMGWVTITGADGETTITNTALTTDFTTADYGSASYPAFGVSKGGVLPRLDQLFRFNVANTSGYKHGIMAVGAGSSADVLAGAGVTYAGTVGIYAYKGSTINAEGALAGSAGSSGLHAAHGSTINAHSADATGAGTYGIVTESGSTINAEGSVGTISQPINTITNNGIIFK